MCGYYLSACRNGRYCRPSRVFCVSLAIGVTLTRRYSTQPAPPLVVSVCVFSPRALPRISLDRFVISRDEQEAKLSRNIVLLPAAALGAVAVS